MTAAADKPPRFPGLPCPGGWEMGRPEPPDSPSNPLAGRYVSMSEFHEIVGGNKRALYELRRRDGGIWTPDPAILVGDIAGWVKEDVVAWGIDTGRLLEDGRINPDRKRGTGKFTEPDPKWRRRTRVYLSISDMGVAMGMTGVGVTHLGLRGRLLDPDVISGKIKGYSAERAETFARQTGRPWNIPDYIAAALEELPEELRGGQSAA